MPLLINYIEYLKDPNLVVRFQKCFGVYSVLDKSKDSNSTNNRVQRENVDKGNVTYLKHSHLYNANVNSRLVKTNNDTSSKTEDTLSSESDIETVSYVISNHFWYYLFIFGTYLGDEVFYASFIPFWFWNIDGAVGRRIVMVWTIVMYIGQGLKDIICWPRPASPPVFRLQKKWSLEHGMPSTHAMVGVAIPFSVIIYTMSRYQYSVGLGVTVAVLWCVLISLSRIYLGMHSVLDVVAGLLLAIILMVPVLPIVDRLDVFLVTNRWSPILLIVITIPLIVFYPTTTHWTPTRGDTTMIISFCVGVHLGAWTNYHMGVMVEPTHPPPYPIIWPSWTMCGTGALRTVIGLCSIVATIAIGKSAQHALMCWLLSEDSRKHHTRGQIAIELTDKYFTYILLGFNVLYVMPNVFRQLKIDRPTFYTEI